MAYYNHYSAVLEHTVFHRFLCKYCGQTSTWIPNTVRGVYAVSALRFSGGSRINYDLERRLNAGAQENLQKKVNIIKKYTAKGYKINAPFWIKTEYSYSFDTRCAHCRKAQGTRIWRHVFSALGLGVLLTFSLAIITDFLNLISYDCFEILACISMFAIPLLFFIYWRVNYHKKVKGDITVEYFWNGR